MQTAVELNHPDFFDNENIESHGYSCCVMAQVYILKKKSEHAIQKLIDSYHYYSSNLFEISNQIEDWLPQALTILSTSLLNNKQESNLLYQQSIVLGTLADVYMQRSLKEDYEEAEIIYSTIIEFIKRYWGEATLQVGDLNCRYAALEEKKENLKKRKNIMGRPTIYTSRRQEILMKKRSGYTKNLMEINLKGHTKVFTILASQ